MSGGGGRAASPSAVAPEEWGVDLYLKDESTHPTGSLKHRLARSLFLIELHGGRCHFVERPDHRTSGSRGRGWTSPRTWSGWRASWGAGN